MKIFISGDLTGPGLPERRIKFNNVEMFLRSEGHEPINPFNINPAKLIPWQERLKILSECDGIFLLTGWRLSVEAKMERHFCSLTKKDIILEKCENGNERLKNERHVIARIKKAIEEATGLTFEEYAVKSREERSYFCRMIFTVQCNMAGINHKRILAFLPRGCHSIDNYLTKYYDECKVNREFREMAEKVNMILNPAMCKIEKK